MAKLKTIILAVILIIIILCLTLWFVVTQPLFWVQSSPSSATVDPARLETHVQQLSEEFIPRDYKHPENLDRTASYIRTEFEQTSGRVSEQPYEVDGEVYRNIILRFGPDTGERIVIGAHYDAFDIHPGADDNASGVAGLIELAHLLDQAPLSAPVELVAYTLEEPPFFRTNGMGSAVHADDLKAQGISIQLMIALDMIGYFSDSPNSQHFPVAVLRYFYPTEGNFIAVIGRLNGGADTRYVKRVMRRTTDLPVYSFNVPPQLIPGVDFSDHLNYWRHDYPAVMVTDTAFLRNRHYHTPDDTLEKLDYDRMAKVVVGVYEVIVELAQ
ncbi:MAG: M28 family peptidase [Chloroflexota bacterium]